MTLRMTPEEFFNSTAAQPRAVAANANTGNTPQVVYYYPANQDPIPFMFLGLMGAVILIGVMMLLAED